MLDLSPILLVYCVPVPRVHYLMPYLLVYHVVVFENKLCGWQCLRGLAQSHYSLPKANEFYKTRRFEL